MSIGINNPGKAQCWHGANILLRNSSAAKPRPKWRSGFTLLELMIVITILMILAAVAVPLYSRHVTEAREAVLKSHLHDLNQLIQQYTLDKGQAPQSLDDLVTEHYLHEIPKDPMTGQPDWDCDQEDPLAAADPQQPGITRCHSHSSSTSISGEAYSSW